MSKKSGLHRHYDKLEPEERFRLDVLAMARGAEVESERLTRSCPMRRYSMTDLAFSDRWRAALEISTITFMEIEKHLAKIQMVRAFREMGPYLRTLMNCNGEDAYTVWSAYLVFCEGAMSLDGRKLLGAIAPEIRAKAETIDAMAERFGLEADGDQAAELEGSMRGLWKRYMDRAA